MLFIIIFLKFSSYSFTHKCNDIEKKKVKTCAASPFSYLFTCLCLLAWKMKKKAAANSEKKPARVQNVGLRIA